jgi:hypothetical protein
MPDLPINPLTQTPAQGPGLVDQYYKAQGIRPPLEVLKESDKLVDTLDKMPQEGIQWFLNYAQKQLDAYYEKMQEDEEDKKRFQEIVGKDADVQQALVSYGNLKKNFSILTQILQGKKLQDPELAKQIAPSLTKQIKKNGIQISSNPNPEELQQKAVLLWMKMKQDTAKAASRFYNRVAWALWKSPKSNGMDKLVARDYLDAAWYSASIKSPLGGLLDKPGIYNQLLKSEISRAMAPSGLKPFISHKAFFGKGMQRQKALDYLEKMPSAYEKILQEAQEKAKGSQGVWLFPQMKFFIQKSFTPEKVEEAEQAYKKTSPSLENTPSLEDAVQAFGNYIQAASQNPSLNAKLEYMIFWEHPDIRHQLEKVQDLMGKARDKDGNVINKVLDRKFQRAVQVYYLKLAQVLREDKRSTPEEKAIASDYINAVALAEKKSKTSMTAEKKP